jgi:serine/threonine-protein kinase
MLDGIVLHALAKDPARRFRDADEFIAVLLSERAALPASTSAAVLVGAAAGGGPVAPDVPADGGGLVMPPFVPVPQETPPPEAEVGRRKRILVWAVALALVAAAVALVLLLAAPAGKVQVPNVARQSEQAAVAALRREGLSPVASQAASTSVPIGFVIGQRPSAGSNVRKGTRVFIAISTGPGSAALPKVEGLSEAHALSVLRKAGFKPASKPTASSSVHTGRVIGTEPPAGTELQVGSGVSVLVSTGPEQVHVPNLIGDSRSAAEAAITGAGLRVGAVTNQPAAGQAPGNVIAQSPRAGTSVPASTVVSLTVAQASNEVPVPAVVGQEEARAAGRLGAAGFSPKVVTAPTSDPSKVGKVLRQSPSPGRKARKGTTVTLTVGVEGSTTTPTTPTTPTTTTTTTPTTPPPAAAAPAP